MTSTDRLLIPNAKLAVLPGGDRFMIWTDPDKLLSPIAAILKPPVPEHKP
jgi:hypothetical protein